MIINNAKKVKMETNGYTSENKCFFEKLTKPYERHWLQKFIDGNRYKTHFVNVKLCYCTVNKSENVFKYLIEYWSMDS
jgi:hypothetical protein